jgi:hypothetical protein
LKRADEGGASTSRGPPFAKLERGDIVIAAKLGRLFRSALDAAVRRSSFRSVPSLQRVQTSAQSRLEPGRDLYSWFCLRLPCRARRPHFRPQNPVIQVQFASPSIHSLSNGGNGESAGSATSLSPVSAPSQTWRQLGLAWIDQFKLDRRNSKQSDHGRFLRISLYAVVVRGAGDAVHEAARGYGNGIVRIEPRVAIHPPCVRQNQREPVAGN